MSPRYENSTVSEFMLVTQEVFSTLVFGAFVVLLLISMAACYQVFYVKRGKKRLSNYIVCNLITSTILFLSNYLGYGAGDWTEAQCTAQMRFSSGMYAIVHFFTYLVLYERSVVVHKSCATILSDNFRLFAKMVYLSTLSVPLILVSLVLFKGLVSYPHCYVITNVYGSFTLSVMDTGLSLSYIYLFARPWYLFMEQVGMLDRANSNAAWVMKEKARIVPTMHKNIRLSLLAVTSTFIAMSVTSFAATFSDDDDSNEAVAYRTYASLLTNIDVLINSFVVMRISNAWIPENIKTWAKKARVLPSASERRTMTKSTEGHNAVGNDSALSIVY